MKLNYNLAWLEGDEIYIRAKFDPVFLDECRTIKGRRWDNKNKINVFPLDSLVEVKALADKWYIRLSNELAELIKVPGETVSLPEGEKNVVVHEGNLVVRFPYSPRMVLSVKTSIPGCSWDSQNKHWVVPASSAMNLTNFAAFNGLTFSDEAYFVFEELMLEYYKMVDASSATDSDSVVIPNMDGELLPYQKAGVAYLKTARKAILGDQPGLGKTIQALATVASEEAFPVVVVCPNSLKYNWLAESWRFFPHLKVLVLEGTKPADVWDDKPDVIIVNYDILKERSPEIFVNGFKSLIVDESHAIKNGKKSHVCPLCESTMRSNAKTCKVCGGYPVKPEERWTVKRTGAVMKLAKSLGPNDFVLLLTGTPITNRPMELVPQLEAIGQLDEFGGAWKFQSRYAPLKNVAINTAELNERMRATCFIRRRKEDVFEELPELRNSVQYLNVPKDKRLAYKKVEANVIEYFAEKAARLASEAGEDEVRAYWHKKISLMDAEHVVKLTALRDAVWQMKHDAIIEWVDNFLESSDDEKVIIYAEHIDMVESIYTRYEHMAVKIRGGVPAIERQNAVEKFQKDPSCRVFVANMTAASEGLTLTAASDVVFCELGWTPAVHEQCVSRAYARANDMHGATAWYLLANDSIDEDIYHLLQRKKKVIDAVVDGIDTEENGSVMSDLIIALAERGMEKYE